MAELNVIELNGSIGFKGKWGGRRRGFGSIEKGRKELDS